MLSRIAVVACLLALAACGDGSDKGADSGASADSLESAVRAYSRAYLSGDGDEAYALLSKRCQGALGEDEFKALTDQAKDIYGNVDVASVKVSVDGGKATATYTFPVETLNQTDEAWVDEDGWKNDDC